jgi:hypothetical protein
MRSRDYVAQGQEMGLGKNAGHVKTSLADLVLPVAAVQTLSGFMATG